MSNDLPDFHIRPFCLTDTKAVQKMAEEHFPQLEPYSANFLKHLVRINPRLVRVVECRKPIQGCPHFHETAVAFVCAYYVCVPLKRKIYNKLKKGKLAEDDLKESDILPSFGKECECILILDLVRDPGCKDNSRLGSRISRHLIRELKIILLNANIQEVGAIISDARVRQMAEDYGLTQVKDYRHPKAESWTFWCGSREGIVKGIKAGPSPLNFWRSLEARPNFFGFGIDLKKLFTTVRQWSIRRRKH